MARQPDGKRGGKSVPTTAQLESFVAMVRWGKQAAVQTALGRSQSQVSRDLSGMEKALGIRLLDRETRKPTPAGEVLLAYAERVLEGWEATRDRLDGASDLKGTVTLVAPNEVHEALLIPLLSRLGARWEDLHILTALAGPDDSVRMLRDGAADIGVLPSGNYEGLNTRPLCSAHLYAAVPAVGGWAARKSVPVNPAPDSRLLLSCPQTSVVAGLFKRTLSGTSGRQARVSHFGGGRQVLLDAVAAQLGVAWMLLFEESGDSLARMLPAQVVLKPVSGLPVKIPFCLAVRKGRPAGGAVEFVLREVLRHFRRA